MNPLALMFSAVQSSAFTTASENKKPVMEPDAVKNTRESKTSVKVTLNTIISAGKEHARHVEPDPQLVN